jgi:CNT family concentrative nucleoside transporter
MITPVPGSVADTSPHPPPPPELPLPPTPWTWRLAIAVGVAAVGLAAYALHEMLDFQHQVLGYRIQAVAGIVCFLGLAALFSKSLQSVKWRTLVWGIGLQITLAVAVIHVDWVQAGFEVVGSGIKALINASDVGAKFVFGPLAEPSPFIFAFRALPPIIFVSSFFSVLYYLGILQLLVKLMARVMMYLMGTSGAETLSVAANVFMGQTEAPLIVKPFVPRMTRSELLALMGSGMAHISGGMMAVYISYGADPVAILTTCVMACPCSLYLTKLVL